MIYKNTRLGRKRQNKKTGRGSLSFPSTEVIIIFYINRRKMVLKIEEGENLEPLSKMRKIIAEKMENLGVLFRMLQLL